MTVVLAQQLIDASKDGAAAFIAFAVMVFLFTGSLFYMDRVRRRRDDKEAARSQPVIAATVSSMSASECAGLRGSDSIRSYSRCATGN